MGKHVPGARGAQAEGGTAFAGGRQCGGRGRMGWGSVGSALDLSRYAWTCAVQTRGMRSRQGCLIAIIRLKPNREHMAGLLECKYQMESQL